MGAKKETAGSLNCRPLQTFSYGRNLSVSAVTVVVSPTMGATATVEAASAATMEVAAVAATEVTATSTVEVPSASALEVVASTVEITAAAAVKIAASVEVPTAVTAKIAASAEVAAAVTPEVATAAIAEATVMEVTVVVTESPEAGAPIEFPVIPRPRADKDAVGEPLRAIVAVGCARVRGIWIVAVGANRPVVFRPVIFRPVITVNRADAYTYRNTLRAGE